MTSSAGRSKRVMFYAVDFNDVSTVGPESSPVAAALESGLSINVMDTIDDPAGTIRGSCFAFENEY
jgi:hypothetical protein